MPIDRYHRQALLPQIGREGQLRLSAARVLLVGCGALGCVIADQLVRAGIGLLRVVDRDIVELTNLQRQVLFDEADVRNQTPKAVAAAAKLAGINSTVHLEPVVADVHAGNVEELAGLIAGRDPVDVILDGTDNVETRYLINDVAVKHAIPWIYGACVGTEGRTLLIRPPHTACLRCLFPEPPAAADLPTCDTAGVLGPAAAIVASLQVTAALRLFTGATHADEPFLTFDVWRSRFREVSTAGAKRPDCPTCGQRKFDFLNRSDANRSTSLCGRNAVQVRSSSVSVNLKQLAQKLGRIGDTSITPHLIRCVLREPADIRLTVFPDGRAIVHGTEDLERARSIYARFIGS